MFDDLPIRLATDEEMAALTGPVGDGVYKGVISDWLMLTWDVDEAPWFIIAGIPEGNPTKLRRTSTVVAIDPERKRVRTRNSIYVLENQLGDLDATYALTLMYHILTGSGS